MEFKDIKKGLFGFNKNNVIEYIAELNRICAEKTEALRHEKVIAVSELEQKNSELNVKLAEIETELVSLRNQIAEKESALSELSNENEQLKAEADKHKANTDELADILNDVKAYISLASKTALSKLEKAEAKITDSESEADENDA